MTAVLCELQRQTVQPKAITTSLQALVRPPHLIAHQFSLSRALFGGQFTTLPGCSPLLGNFYWLMSQCWSRLGLQTESKFISKK